MMEIGLLEAEISLILSFKYDRKSAILKMASHMSLHHFQHVYPRKYTCRPSLDHRSTAKLRDPQNFYGSIGWVQDYIGSEPGFSKLLLVFVQKSKKGQI